LNGAGKAGLKVLLFAFLSVSILNPLPGSIDRRLFWGRDPWPAQAIQPNIVSLPVAPTFLQKPASWLTGPAPPVTPPAFRASAQIEPENIVDLSQVGMITFRPWDLVTALAWSPDGKKLAIAAGEDIYLYDAFSLEQLAFLPVGALSHSLEFSPDGSRLAAASRDGQVRVWGIARASSLPLVWRRDAHRQGANRVAFSPDGSLLASSGNDGLIQVWQAQSGDPYAHFIAGSFSTPSVAFSPDGSWLAIANGPLARMREVESGRIGATFRAGQDAWLYSLAISPDGRSLAVGDLQGRVWFWAGLAAFDGQALVGDPQQLSGMQEEGLVWSLNFSPDGRLLAAGGATARLNFWRADTGKWQGSLRGHQGAVTCLHFNPTGDVLATGSLDATVRLWAVR
jgi:WD40 repeat protein